MPAVTSTPACPACSSTRGRATKVVSVFECSCGAIHGSCYKGEGYEFYRPYWHEGRPDGEIVYVDLELLGSEGITRFHGWVNKETRRIVQVG